MILYINTKEKNKVEVVLRDAQGTLIKSLSAKNKFGSQVLLPLIMKLLQPTRFARRETYNLKTLKAIEVETEPGSFTGLRVGVAVANALGYSLGISVNGKKIETSLKY